MEAIGGSTQSEKKHFRVRTVTAFVVLRPTDFHQPSTQGDDSNSLGKGGRLKEKIDKAAHVLRIAESKLIEEGYEIQTVRIATNPFGEWLCNKNGNADEKGSGMAKKRQKPGREHEIGGRTENTHESQETKATIAKARLKQLDSLLHAHSIDFCSLGPSGEGDDTSTICPVIISESHRFSCSADVKPTDVISANAAAKCIIDIAHLGEGATDEKEPPSHLAGGQGNFRFCVAASCLPHIPFFPAAKCASDADFDVGFALGLENGALARQLLSKAETVQEIGSTFRDGMATELMPLQSICEKLVMVLNDGDFDVNVKYLGIDTSLNPSLDEGGSVAEAVETLQEVGGNFGGRGTLSAAAAITTALQSLHSIKTTGYCGLMLPVCEDRRLSALASEQPSKLRISQILSISSVCGVGIDTVPIPGTCSVEELASVILDVAGLAGRWGKSLSCRVFPYPNAVAGEFTSFDLPYLCNSRIFSLE